MSPTTRDIESLRNVRAGDAVWLRRIGVHTIDHLRAAGPVTVYVRLKHAGLLPRIGLLWELYAGLRNLPCTALSSSEKHQLVRALAAADTTVRIR